MQDAAFGNDVSVAALAARIAAQLARDTVRACDDLARDAVSLALAAMDARAARCIGNTGSYDRAIARLVNTAELYGAHVIEANDSSGMIVGLELPASSSYTCGHEHNWFYLA